MENTVNNSNKTSEFKAGDKVTCIDEKGYITITLYNTYEVLSVKDISGTQCLLIENDYGTPVHFVPECFELAFEQPEESKEGKTEVNLQEVAKELSEALQLMLSTFLDTEGNHGDYEHAARDAGWAAVEKYENFCKKFK